MKMKIIIRNIKYEISKPFKRIYNYFLIKKYPWMAPFNVWTGKLDDNYKYEYTWYDDIPDGWRKSFGKLLLDDIYSEIGKDCEKMNIQQIKEKFGELRYYCGTTKEVQDKIDAYEHISRNVCIKCGKPEAYMLNLSWVSPYCEKCFNKLKKRNKYYATKEYKDYIYEEDTGHLPMQYKYTRFSKENGKETMTVDLSETSKKIIKRWNKLHPFNKVDLPI